MPALLMLSFLRLRPDDKKLGRRSVARGIRDDEAGNDKEYDDGRLRKE